MKNFVLLFVIALLGSTVVRAQDDKALLEKVMNDDSDVVSIIALYDEDVRTDLFTAASSAELAARLGDAQKRSNERFKQALSSYAKEDQTKIWNMTRYDNLISTLQSLPNKDRASVAAVVGRYPEDIRADAMDITLHHPEVLASVDVIRRDFDQSANTTLLTYPMPVQNAYRSLLRNPSALSVLNDNMRTTVLLGDLYKRNPEMVRQRFKDLNVELVNRKAKDLEEWKAQLEKDPQAQSELQQSARDFANDQGYRSQEYTTSQPPVIERTVFVSYPYWSGYPWWYVAPCWYPYPYWYHWGFYFWNGHPVWISTPSWYFLRWHFHHHPHFAMYPHITNCYFDYFNYGPRRYYARSAYETRRWFGENRSRFPADFKQNTAQRIERIRVLNPAAVGNVRSASPLPDGRRLPVDVVRPTIPQSKPDPTWGRKKSDVPVDKGNSPRDPGSPSPNPSTPRSVPRQESPRSNPDRTSPSPQRPQTPSRPRPSPGVTPTPKAPPAPARQAPTPSTAPRIPR